MTMRLKRVVMMELSQNLRYACVALFFSSPLVHTLGSSRMHCSQVTEAVSFGCKFYFRNGNTILLRTVCNKKQRWNTVVHHFSEHTNLKIGEGRERQRERGITMQEGVGNEGGHTGHCGTS
jgi:hypothetical protein